MRTFTEEQFCLVECSIGWRKNSPVPITLENGVFFVCWSMDLAKYLQWYSAITFILLKSLFSMGICSLKRSMLLVPSEFACVVFGYPFSHYDGENRWGFILWFKFSYRLSWKLFTGILDLTNHSSAPDPRDRNPNNIIIPGSFFFLSKVFILSLCTSVL